MSTDNNNRLESKYPLFIGIHVGAGYHSKKLSRSYRDVVERCLKRTKEIVYQTISDIDNNNNNDNQDQEQQDNQQQLMIDASSIVEIVIQMLEDDPLTNSGRGSNLNFDGQIECDASLMDGQFKCCCNNDCFTNNNNNDINYKYTIHKQRKENGKPINNMCGGGIWAGVGAVNGVNNPIRLVGQMVKKQKKSSDKSLGRVRPLMLIGSGAKEWAMNHNIETYDSNSLFGDPLITQQSNLTYMKHKSKLEYWKTIKHLYDDNNTEHFEEGEEVDEHDKYQDEHDHSQLNDTVGAVVVDWNGNISAGVSSGGISLKHPGRVGEAAIFGSGCWAQNELVIINDSDKQSTLIPGVAASCTGVGEQIMKNMMAKDCCKLIIKKKYADIGVKRYFDHSFLSHKDCFSYLSEFIPKVDNIKEENEKQDEEEEEEEDIGNSYQLNGEKRLGGLIALKKHTNQKNESMEIEFVWAHTTSSMVVGYISSSMENPKSLVSRLSSTSSNSMDEKDGKVLEMSSIITTI